MYDRINQREEQPTQYSLEIDEKAILEMGVLRHHCAGLGSRHGVAADAMSTDMI